MAITHQCRATRARVGRRSLLRQQLASIRLSVELDAPIWSRNSSLQFTMKSAYIFLSEMPYIHDSTFRFWEIRAPFRVQVFLWLLLQNKLLTAEI
jgi:zinc-binding in reverse transcriptase